MKEATSEVSGVVIVIVVLAGILAIGTVLFKEGGPAQKWIENMFEDKFNVDAEE